MGMLTIVSSIIVIFSARGRPVDTLGPTSEASAGVVANNNRYPATTTRHVAEYQNEKWF